MRLREMTYHVGSAFMRISPRAFRIRSGTFGLALVHSMVVEVRLVQMPQVLSFGLVSDWVTVSVFALDTWLKRTWISVRPGGGSPLQLLFLNFAVITSREHQNAFNQSKYIPKMD